MLFQAYNLTIDSDFDLELPMASKRVKDFCFKPEEIPSAKGFKTNVFRKGLQANIIIENEQLILDWPTIGKFKASKGEILEFQKNTNDDDVFRLFATSEALGLILQQRGYFLLHGSAVKVGEKAIVFIGVPGAGKSTTIAAFAKAGYTILSDDMTAITFDNSGRAAVLPGIPQIKIWEESARNLDFDPSNLEPAYEGHQKYIFRQSENSFPDTAIDLDQIVVLQKPYSKKNHEIRLLDVPIELIKYYPLPQQILRGAHLERHFTDSLKIAAQVTVKRVNRPLNYEKLRDFVKTFG
ncbi:serine kinase [Lacihabitans sp. CCS-44]|uniref:serine kinase n=1 Tax=Lacihabitans sp. CCS-44 TaxID=2487331 RepID=UPI0020CD03DC|nr:serine kinase [Lacihabitans sp. CCS-44]MCP9754760.1 serine kinase [Lacihabitans sp. CCS-44]